MYSTIYNSDKVYWNSADEHKTQVSLKKYNQA